MVAWPQVVIRTGGPAPDPGRPHGGHAPAATYQPGVLLTVRHSASRRDPFLYASAQTLRVAANRLFFGFGDNGRKAKLTAQEHKP